MCIECTGARTAGGVSRRTVLKGAAATVGILAAPGAVAREPRTLSFYHTNRG
jgi:hypothetical protein